MFEWTADAWFDALTKEEYDKMSSNNPPDVILELTHEQATFLLESGLANMRMGMAMVLSIADEKITQEEKQKKAEKIEDMRKKFSEINRLLRRAGAREKED